MNQNDQLQPKDPGVLASLLFLVLALFRSVLVITAFLAVSGFIVGFFFAVVKSSTAFFFRP